MSYDVFIGDYDANITSNVGKFFRTFIHKEEGLNRLNGMTGRQASFALAEAINRFARYRDFNDDVVLDREFSAPNGWGSWEDAFLLLTYLQLACLRHPRKIVRVHR